MVRGQGLEEGQAKAVKSHRNSVVKAEKYSGVPLMFFSTFQFVC